MKRTIILIFSIIPILSFAQTLSLEECRRMALESNRTLKNSSLASLNAKDDLQAYRTKFFPRLTATGSYVYSNIGMNSLIPGGYLPTFVPDPQTGELTPNIITTLPDGTPVFKEYAYMPDTPIDFKVGSVWSGGLLFEQPLYTGGKIRSAVSMAKIGLGLSSLNEKKNEKDIIAQTDEAYWTCVKTQELLKSAHKYREVVTEFYRQMENAREVGMKTKNDLLKVQVRLNEAELRCRQAENGVALSRMNLCQKIGLPLSTSTLKLLESSDTSQELTDKSLDITNRPEYEMLQRMVDLKREEVKFTRSEFLPQVAAIASYSYANGVKINDYKLFDNASFTGGVTLSIPILHWTEGRKKVSAAKRQIEVANNQLKENSELMQLELMKALNTYDEAVLEVVLMQKSVQQAEENMRMSADQYAAGLETIADYLESQALWQKAESNFIEAKAKRRLAYTHYLKAAGRL